MKSKINCYCVGCKRNLGYVSAEEGKEASLKLNEKLIDANPGFVAISDKDSSDIFFIGLYCKECSPLANTRRFRLSTIKNRFIPASISDNKLKTIKIIQNKISDEAQLALTFMK